MNRRSFLKTISALFASAALPITFTKAIASESPVDISERPVYFSSSKIIQDIRKEGERLLYSKRFEINDRVVRYKCKSHMTEFMRSAPWSRQVYDFLVRCDEDINTFESIDRGELHLHVYLRLNHEAVFRCVQFTVITEGLKVSV